MAWVNVVSSLSLFGKSFVAREHIPAGKIHHLQLEKNMLEKRVVSIMSQIDAIDHEIAELAKEKEQGNEAGTESTPS